VVEAARAALGIAFALGPVLLAALVAELAHRAREKAAAADGSATNGRDATLAKLLVAASALGAGSLLLHLLVRPPADLTAAAGDPRALCFAALAGPALASLATHLRTAAIAALSLGIVGYFAGAGALGLNLAVLLPAYALVRHLAPRRPGLAAWLQGALLAGGAAGLVALRLHAGAAGLAAWSLYAFAGMRHLSFAAGAAQGPPPTLLSYLGFLFFYPTCIGAMEVWSEFRDRNLLGAPPRAIGEALRRLVVGTIALTLALSFDASMQRVLAASGWLATWSEVLRLFLRSSLGITGIWAAYEAGALLLGWRVRPNFRGILLAESPSAFWRAWRGTMTNWLIRHVYVPLGGNRRSRTRNVAAAFGVSGAWHCLGTLLLYGEATTLASLAPVASWALVSFLGVALHGALRARRPARPPTGPGGLAVRGFKIAGTWLYGSFTVTLLDTSLSDPERFVLFLRRISGIG